MNSLESWKEYEKLLPVARKIHESIRGLPTSHVEWATSFNEVGDIVRLLLNRDYSEK